MGWFRRKLSVTSSSVNRLPSLDSPLSQSTFSVTDKSSQASVLPLSLLSPINPPAAEDDGATNSVVHSFLRKRSASTNWVLKIAALIQVMTEENEIQVLLTNLCTSVDLILERKPSNDPHKSAWNKVFTLMERHRETFCEYLRLIFNEDALHDTESPFLPPLHSYSRELESITACLVAGAGSTAKHIRRSSLSESMKNCIQRFEGYPVTEERILQYTDQLGDQMRQFLIAMSVYAGSPGATTEYKLNVGDREAGSYSPHGSYVDFRLAPPHGSQHNECLPNTRVAILDYLDTWLNQEASKERIICLVDFAGTGKSTIANHVSRKWDNEGRLAARFFFSHGFNGSSTAQDILTYITRALRTSFPELGDQMQGAEATGKLTIGEQWQQFVVLPLSLVDRQPLVIVIDALDECSSDSREQLVAAILETFHSPGLLPNFKLLLTTRKDPKTERTLSAAGVVVRMESLTATAQQKAANLRDISLYIRHRFSHLSEPRMMDQECKDLLSRSDGRFIFAATACTVLVRSRNRRVYLKRITTDYGVAALDALYLQILRQASEMDEACSVEQLRLFLGVVLVAQQPLPVTTILSLISNALPPAHLARLIESLAGLITGGTQGEPIRIVHPTFREFLLKASVSKEYCISTSLAHHIVAKSCLLLLLNGLTTDICSLSTPGDPLPLNQDIQKLQLKIHNCVPPPLEYAALNWAIHILPSLYRKDVCALMRKFFTWKLLNWLELGYLCGQVSAYTLALKNLQVAMENYLSLDQSSVHDVDNQWCSDTIRLIQTNQAILEVSLLHLYTSVLAFGPRDSLITRHYAPIFKNALPTTPRAISATQKGSIVLKGHKGAVKCASYSDDGLHIVSGSQDGTLIRWNAETGMRTSQSSPKGRSVNSVSHSPHGNAVIFGSDDGCIRRWDWSANIVTELSCLGSHEAISSLSWSYSGLEISGGTASGSLWRLSMLFPADINNYGRVHSDSINCVAYSPDGTTVASASSDGTVRMWNIEALDDSASPLFILEHASAVLSLAFSPNRPLLASGTEKIHVWRTDTGEEIFRGISEGILRSLSYSPDGSQILTTHGSSIRQRETNTRGFTGSMLEGHTEAVLCATYSPKGDFIVSGSDDRTLRLWNLSQAGCGQEAAGHQSRVTSVSFPNDGDSLASAAADGTFCIWNVEKGLLKLGPIHTPLRIINAIAYSSSMELVACASAAHFVELWSTRTGMCTDVRLPYRFESGAVSCVIFSPDGGFVAVKAFEERDVLLVWSLSKFNTVQPVVGRLVMRRDAIEGKFAFHPSGQHICIDEQVWDLRICPPKLIPSEEGLQSLLLESFPSHISYRSEHGLDWIHVGEPPRQSYVVPTEFNVVSHAIHNNKAALGAEDGRVVFVDCHQLASRLCWKLNSEETNPVDIMDRWQLPKRPQRKSTGGSSRTLNGNPFTPPIQTNNFSISESSQLNTESIISTMDSATSNMDFAVPDLTELVHRRQRKPIFDGTYSTVYEGELDGKKVAIKALRAVNTLHSMRRKYRRELETWWRLRHPNVLPLLGCMEDDDLGDFGVMVSPWAERGNAAAYIATDINYTQRVSLLHDVSKGLQYLHEFNPTVVHADLKPSNVLIDGDGTARLCDFGLVRLVQDETDTGMTTTTAHAGTARYLAFELVELLGEHLPTPESDVHALACIGMEFIFVCPPYAEIRSTQSNAHYRICKAIGNKIAPAARPKGLNEIVSDLWNTFELCWNVEASYRPSANEVCQYLATNGQELAYGLAMCEDAIIEPRDIL